jgi:hypothetical protein
LLVCTIEIIERKRVTTGVEAVIINGSVSAGIAVSIFTENDYTRKLLIFSLFDFAVFPELTFLLSVVNETVILMVPNGLQCL